MGCEAMKLPIIDFPGLKQETPTSESVKSQVREALEEYGCFEAKLDDQNIPLHLRKSLFDGLQQLFDLPLENKQRNRSDKPYHGYTGKIAPIPLYESLGINDALSPGSIETFTNLMWSQGNPTFRDNVQSLSEKLSKMDQMVRTMVVESLGLEKYMNCHLDWTNYVIRVQKYDAPPSNETNKLGLLSHTDKNIVTILYQNKAWTNGRLHPPFHMVMMNAEDEARYSIGLFSIPSLGHIIKAPNEMVDEKHPLLSKPFDYAEFIQFFYSKVGLTSADPLKAYCGVT